MASTGTSETTPIVRFLGQKLLPNPHYSSQRKATPHYFLFGERTKLQRTRVSNCICGQQALLDPDHCCSNISKYRVEVVALANVLDIGAKCRPFGFKESPEWCWQMLLCMCSLSWLFVLSWSHSGSSQSCPRSDIIRVIYSMMMENYVVLNMAPRGPHMLNLCLTTWAISPAITTLISFRASSKHFQNSRRCISIASYNAPLQESWLFEKTSTFSRPQGHPTLTRPK